MSPSWHMDVFLNLEALWISLLRSFYYLDIAPPEKQHPLFTWLVFMVANPMHCLVADSEAASSDQLVWSKDLL